MVQLGGGGVGMDGPRDHFVEVEPRVAFLAVGLVEHVAPLVVAAPTSYRSVKFSVLTEFRGRHVVLAAFGDEIVDAAS